MATYELDEPARVLVADPAWMFDDKLPGKGRGAEKHYKCLAPHEIMRFPLPSLADDCVLAMWRIGSMQSLALKVIEAWGFDEPFGEIVWIKTKVGTKPTKAVRMGMGRRGPRNVHEICLLAVRGKPQRVSAGVVSAVFAPRGRHSEKPDVFYQAIESLYSGPYVELFARRTRPGWYCFGNEL